jgi:hypothetical protein
LQQQGLIAADHDQRSNGTCRHHRNMFPHRESSYVVGLFFCSHVMIHLMISSLFFSSIIT